MSVSTCLYARRVRWPVGKTGFREGGVFGSRHVTVAYLVHILEFRITLVPCYRRMGLRNRCFGFRFS